MKNIYLLLLCCLITRFATAQQLNAGDLMCVGFNADGNDDLSFVALAPIPANTTLYFRDDEWDGTAFNTGESAWSWNSGTTAIATGTIIAFKSFGLAAASANIGTLTAAIPTNFGIAAGGDAVFVYQGSDVNTPTRFILAVTNGAPATNFSTLAGTGLTEGSTAQVLTPTGVDIAAYKGVRSGLDRNGYITALNNIANWETQDADGDQSVDGITPDVPFSTTPFVFGAGGVAPEIGFETPSVSGAENASIPVRVTLKNPNGTPTTVSVRVANVKNTATDTEDFVFQNQTITFSGDTAAAARTITVVFTPTNDATTEADEYVVLELTAPTNATIGTAVNSTILFIQDDDRKAPVATNELKIKQLASYSNGLPANNTAEIVAYEAVSKRLFIANTIGDKIDIVDFTNPSVPRPIRSISIKGVNSVAAKNGFVVACAEDTVAITNSGRVVFMDSTGLIFNELKVGVLPDMVAISPDGKWIMTADEAQPNDAYTIDPEGSVHLIDISTGVYYATQADVTRIGFSVFNARKTELQAYGVRIYGKIKDATTTVSVAQDLEPEYIAFTPDSRRAMVTLQENNAVVIIDVLNKKLDTLRGSPALVPLGYKNHSLATNGFDATDQGTAVNIANWNVRGMYQPDAIASYQTGGQTYFVTANEGDARAYTGFNEESSLAAVRLDPTKFPDSTVLRRNLALGRMVITNATGDTDGDGDMDEIHVFGGRSFSILNDVGQIVWDSGDWLERLTKDSTYFNASNGAGITKKARSRAKGPEPEGVTTATLGGRSYAFIALERTGGLMAFNITNPTNPQFVTYVNNRKGTTTDDRGAEGIIFIPSAQSPNGKNLVLLANETSSTISIFEIDASATPTKEQNTEGVDFTIYPNPSANSTIYLSRELRGKVVNMAGQMVLNFLNPTTQLDVSTLQNGLYFFVSEGNQTKRFVIQK